MKTILKALLFLLLSAEVTAGDFYIAPQLAYGKSASLQLHANSYEFELFHLFGNDDDFVFLRSGAMFSYERKWFSYVTGLLYSRVIIDQYYYGEHFRGLSILQLPLVCNLHFGKKLYGYLSMGAYLNYLHPKGSSGPDFPDFQPGITGGIGLGYRFTPLLAIDILYRAEDGLRPLYFTLEHTSAGPWGYTYIDGHNIPFRTLTLSLKISLGRKNSECRKRK
jgi:hypothetical protein